MSRGENDNLDELDSWEKYDDETELEKRLKQEKIKREEEMQSNQNGLQLMTNGGDVEFKPRILQRQPKQQQQQNNPIKILKRPENSSSSSSSSSSAFNQQQNNSKQMKTLEQREKEYAEARMRILGSNYSAEAANNLGDQQNKQAIYNSSKVSPSSSSNSLQNFSQPPPPLLQRTPDNIVRQPRGPNLGHGFNVRR